MSEVEVDKPNSDPELEPKPPHKHRASDKHHPAEDPLSMESLTLEPVPVAMSIPEGVELDILELIPIHHPPVQVKDLTLWSCPVPWPFLPHWSHPTSKCPAFPLVPSSTKCPSLLTIPPSFPLPPPLPMKASYFIPPLLAPFSSLVPLLFAPTYWANPSRVFRSPAPPLHVDALSYSSSMPS